MTNEKAIGELLRCRALHESDNGSTADGDLVKAIDIAIARILKNTPMKVKRQAESGNAACPSCGFDATFKPINVRNMKVTYCCRCGQAINWGDADET